MAIIQKSRRGKVIEFSAWEPQEKQFSYSTIIDGQYVGLVGSEFTPAGRDRDEWRQEAQERAYKLIIEKYPHAASGKREGGRIYYTTGR